ncbi:SAM-dependent methyltransferase [Streptosporangiaceae bacterium NEAU-GS5]|nr:SAM-dependent methyltransferase [Streptosporangiaceae bacterium NEAU-GS5]
MSDIERLFAGLEMVEPGVVVIDEWHGDGVSHGLHVSADGGAGRTTG